MSVESPGRAPGGPGSPPTVGGRPTRRRSPGALERALREASYEVLPLRGAEDSVVEHVPRTVPLTVTVTEAKGLTPTIELAERLRRHGFVATPHLAARLVRDRAHLADIVARLRAAGVDSVFVIGGDAAEPAGRFPDALSLLEELETVGHHFQDVGIGGYPEGHGHISAELIERALERKTPHRAQPGGASTSSRSTRWRGPRRGGRSGWLGCPTRTRGSGVRRRRRGDGTTGEDGSARARGGVRKAFRSSPRRRAAATRPATPC